MKKREASGGAKKRPKRIRRRSNDRLIMLFSLLLVAGIVGASTMWPKAVSSKAVEQKPPVVNDLDTVLVPTPLRIIARGEKLADVPFTESKWPKNKLSPQYIKTIAEYKDAIALTPLPAHVPIALSSVSKKIPDGNAVIQRIPEGMRAITVKVDSESAVEGWARSGSFVDVIVLRMAADKSQGMEAKVISENVKILSAGRSVEPLTSGSSAPRAPATITLLVSQDDALRIKTATTVGKLTFALRGLGDQAPTQSVSMNQRNLLGSSKTVLPRKAGFKGRATGPDGKTYVLSPDSRWIRDARQSE